MERLKLERKPRVPLLDLPRRAPHQRELAHRTAIHVYLEGFAQQTPESTDMRTFTLRNQRARASRMNKRVFCEGRGADETLEGKGYMDFVTFEGN